MDVLAIAVVGAAIWAETEQRLYPGSAYSPSQLTVRWCKGFLTRSGVRVWIEVEGAWLRPGLPLVRWGPVWPAVGQRRSVGGET